MQVSRETINNLTHGHTVVGTVRTPLNALGFSAAKHVLLRAAESNTAPVWVGDSGVAPATGLPLLPSDRLLLPLNSPGLLYVISTAPNQDISWLLV